MGRSIWGTHARTAAIVFTLLAALGSSVHAQQQPTPQPPNPPPPQPAPMPLPPPPPHLPPPAVGPPAVQPYRSPVIALVQPAAGTVLPQDRPVAVFRFSAGEASDPVDAGTFAVSVGGHDRTSLFHVTAGEAWGPLGPAGAEPAVGSHEVRARVCSTRGACAMTTALVTIGTPGLGTEKRKDPEKDRRSRLLDFLLDAAKTLLQP